MNKYQYKVQGVDYDVEIEEVEGNVAKVNVNGIRFDVELKQPINATSTLKKVHVAIDKGPRGDYNASNKSKEVKAMHTLVSLLIGALVGWLAGKIMHSKGGLIRNIILGLVGGALGGWLGGLIGVEPTSWISSILIGIGGSCLLIWLMRKLFK